MGKKMQIKTFNNDIKYLESKGLDVLTSEGFMPAEYMRSEVYDNNKLIFKGKNEEELIKFTKEYKKKYENSNK